MSPPIRYWNKSKAIVMKKRNKGRDNSDGMFIKSLLLVLLKIQITAMPEKAKALLTSLNFPVKV